MGPSEPEYKEKPGYEGDAGPLHKDASPEDGKFPSEEKTLHRGLSSRQIS
jgi:hypothetical protein